MAIYPDAIPDSPPAGSPDAPEQVSPAEQPDRENIEDSPGEFQGTAGTGGENRVQDQSFER
ncbi:hypothetical protein [uncultured Sphingomonas sp.]|uniref:hypothetical protein n=1 Tax=uncultured Sphingomonas sp. TaxID=158754 RepID=UPI0025CC88D4|nr:hypothetical protein [uncultured Sphingomonas sp.]